MRPVGRDPLATRICYFKGPRERWLTDLPTFARVVYPDAWPGIDVEFRGAEGGVTYAFRLDRGADPADMQLAWHGQPSLRPAAAEEGPAVPAGRSTFGARRTAQDAFAYPVYAGFFGVGGHDRGLGIAVDDAGSAYICGETTDPVTGDTDAYVAKLSPDGGSYAYVAMIGGDAYDAAFDIAVDGDGNAFLTGVAMSDQASFPVTMGPDLTHNGVVDTAVVKVAPSGNDLVYAGFLGGELTDFGEGIRVGADGSAYVHGIAMSTEATFPVKVGPDLTFNGETDAFVAKVLPVPDAPDVADNLVYSGYIGGEGSDITLVQDGTYSTVSSGHTRTRSLRHDLERARGTRGLPGRDRRAHARRVRQRRPVVRHPGDGQPLHHLRGHRPRPIRRRALLGRLDHHPPARRRRVRPRRARHPGRRRPRRDHRPARQRSAGGHAGRRRAARRLRRPVHRVGRRGRRPVLEQLRLDPHCRDRRAMSRSATSRRILSTTAIPARPVRSMRMPA